MTIIQTFSFLNLKFRKIKASGWPPRQSPRARAARDEYPDITLTAKRKSSFLRKKSLHHVAVCIKSPQTGKGTKATFSNQILGGNSFEELF